MAEENRGVVAKLGPDPIATGDALVGDLKQKCAQVQRQMKGTRGEGPLGVVGKVGVRLAPKMGQANDVTNEARYSEGLVDMIGIFVCYELVYDGL